MISVLFATTGRPLMAEKAIRSLIETSGEHVLEIVVAVDCDKETADRVAYMDHPWNVHFVMDERDEYRGCSRAWNDALRASQGDPVVLAADDLVFQPGWLDAALSKLAEFEDGWGLVGFNDGHWDEHLSTHYLISRRFILEVLGGVIAWECYTHSFNDVEINERARLANRYAWCKTSRVEHVHWLWGDRPMDGTDVKNLGEHAESQRIFEQRRAAGFPNDYKAVITK